MGPATCHQLLAILQDTMINLKVKMAVVAAGRQFVHSTNNLEGNGRWYCGAISRLKLHFFPFKFITDAVIRV